MYTMHVCVNDAREYLGVQVLQKNQQIAGGFTAERAVEGGIKKATSRKGNESRSEANPSQRPAPPHTNARPLRRCTACSTRCHA